MSIEPPRERGLGSPFQPFHHRFMKPRSARAPRRSRAGFAIVDVCVSLLILVVALGALLGSVFSAMKLAEVNESTASASQAVRGILETMSALPLEQVYAAYNSDPQDDPDKNQNYLEGLEIPAELLSPQGGTASVAEISFPTLAGVNGTELREDLVDPELGMPRDLNGDGEIDALDHSQDYQLLPVAVKLEWNGPAGPQVLEVCTLLWGG